MATWYVLVAIDPAASTATFADHSEDGRRVAEVRVNYRVDGEGADRRVRIVAVSVEVDDPELRAITEASMAAVRLSDLIEMIELALAGWPEPPSSIDTSAWPSGNGFDDLLADVAAAYRWARLAGSTPLQAVMEATGASRTTASRMIRDAKMKGLIA